MSSAVHQETGEGPQPGGTPAADHGTALPGTGGGETGTPAPAAPGARVPFARTPVLVLAAVTFLLLMAVSNRFGYFADELYFLVAGRHPDWGYVDQPPLLPLLSHAIDTASGGSLVALRFPVALMAGAGVALTGLIARDLGGGRGPQVLAAFAYAVSPVVLQTGHLFTTGGVDLFLGTLTAWLLVRWVHTRNDNLLLVLGLVTALQLQVKYVGAAFWVVLLGVALVVGPKDLPRRPKLWIAAALVTLTVVPGLVWQAAHGWPQLEMAEVISAETSRSAWGRLAFPPALLWGAGFLGTVLLVLGLWRLLRSAEWAPYRFLGWTFAVLGTIFLLTNGRPYYMASFFAMVWAVGAIEFHRRKARRWWRPVTWTVTALSLLVVSQVLPLYPRDVMENPTVDALARETVGWPELAGAVAREYRALPPEKRRDAAIIADRFEQGGAVDRFGPDDLPEVYSGHRGYWHFGRPADGVGTVLYIGADAAYLRERFGRVERVATFDNGMNIDNITQGMPIWLCEDPVKPWATGWEDFYHLIAVKRRGTPVG